VAFFLQYIKYIILEFTSLHHSPLSLPLPIQEIVSIGIFSPFIFYSFFTSMKLPCGIFPVVLLMWCVTLIDYCMFELSLHLQM
jgi:hypothetical protein